MDHPYQLIAVTSLLCGLTAGHVMYRADFCVAAACRDIFLFRDYFMARMLLLVVVVSALLFEAARLAGLLGPCSAGRCCPGCPRGKQADALRL
jgi:hypothetical protein